jgi:hypothetical protein
LFLLLAFRKRIEKKWAYKVAINTENGILIFGRSKVEYCSPKEAGNLESH